METEPRPGALLASSIALAVGAVVLGLRPPGRELLGVVGGWHAVAASLMVASWLAAFLCLCDELHPLRGLIEHVGFTAFAAPVALAIAGCAFISIAPLFVRPNDAVDCLQAVRAETIRIEADRPPDPALTERLRVCRAEPWLAWLP